VTRWTLPPDRIPSAWFNVVPHLPTPLDPPLHPGTREPVGPQDLAPLFPAALIEQEVSAAPWIDVPGEVLDILRLWRPTPLVRAVRLEKELGTPARIYFKDESVSPAGSHKPNTAVPQAFYNHRDGVRRLTTETGAGQWGTALAFACAQFDLDLKVYMVRASYEQKPYRRIAIETWGGEVVPSPVDEPGHPGSLGSAISDAVRDCVGRDDTHYALGSVLNHVLLHQTVIGLEAKEQLELAGERLPDVVIAPCGGGSNLGGIAFPFVPDAGVRLLAVEPLSCPTLTQGRFEYDYGDTAGLTRSCRCTPSGTTSCRPRSTPVGCATTATRRWSPRSCGTGGWRPSRTRRARCSRPPCSSRRWRAGSRRRSAVTRSARPSTKPWPRRRPARRRSSCSTTAATGSWTCRRTTTTATAAWWTSRADAPRR
jgi:tryptophan synthase beta chain